MIVCDKHVVGPWVSTRINGSWSPEAAETIGWESEGEITAGVIYENWNGVSMMVHIACDKPMTKTFVKRIFGYPFAHASKLIAPVAESNEKSIKLVENMGFRKEAQILDAHPDGSLLIYTMDKAACRFIKERYGQIKQSAKN